MRGSRTWFAMSLLLLSCRSRPTDGQPPSATDVSRACARLKVSGFAVSCGKPIVSGARADLDFELTGGFRGERGHIAYGNPAMVVTSSGDRVDYIRLRVESPDSNLAVTTSSDVRWNQCVDRDGGPSANLHDCARKFPREHAFHHALYDEAKRVVGDYGEPSVCEHGFLCGDGCFPITSTCCIDAFRKDSCPDAGFCLPSGGCASVAPGPQKLNSNTTPAAKGGNPCGGGCPCNDGSCGCCGRGCCSHHGGIQ